ncbi:MAG: ABC transporter permease [Bacteroidales bacterium]|nr:ABC transporter permease [Bacteroidales bacterium]
MLVRLYKRFVEALPENNQIERIWILAKTDFKLRYYGTFLGLFWALINPLFRLSVYYIVFSLLMAKKIPNYGLYIFSGLLIWLFFQESTKRGMKVLKSKRYLLENIEFNKLDLFISSTLTSTIGLIFNTIIYLIVSLLLGIFPNVNILYLPLLILNVFILVFAISLILSTIHIFMQDVSQVWEMILVAMFWINPIFYAKSALVFDKLPVLLYLNPIAGIIVNTRNILLYGQPPEWPLLLFDFAYASVFLLIGLTFFRFFFNKAAEKF